MRCCGDETARIRTIRKQPETQKKRAQVEWMTHRSVPRSSQESHAHLCCRHGRCAKALHAKVVDKAVRAERFTHSINLLARACHVPQHNTKHVPCDVQTLRCTYTQLSIANRDTPRSCAPIPNEAKTNTHKKVVQMNIFMIVCSWPYLYQAGAQVGSVSTKTRITDTVMRK